MDAILLVEDDHILDRALSARRGGASYIAKM
jgi:hypothetical protein